MKILIGVFLLLCLCWGGIAMAVGVSATDDIWIREVSPDSTYNGDGVTVWSTAKGDRRYGIISFDLSGLAGTTVTEAHLALYSAVHGWSDYETPILQSAFVIDDAGTPAGSLTWNSYMAEKDATKQALETLGYYDLPPASEDPSQQDRFVFSDASANDIALIQAAIDGDGIFSIVIIADEGDEYGQTWGDAELMGEDAVLWINEIPEPATLALLGLGGLALVRRRNRR